MLSHPFPELDHHLGIRRRRSRGRDDAVGAEEGQHVLDALPQRLPMRLCAGSFLYEVRRQAIVDILEHMVATIEPLAERPRPAEQTADCARGIPTRGERLSEGIDVRAEQALAVAAQTVWSLVQRFDHRSVLQGEG